MGRVESFGIVALIRCNSFGVQFKVSFLTILVETKKIFHAHLHIRDVGRSKGQAEGQIKTSATPQKYVKAMPKDIFIFGGAISPTGRRVTVPALLSFFSVQRRLLFLLFPFRLGDHLLVSAPVDGMLPLKNDHASHHCPDSAARMPPRLIRSTGIASTTNPSPQLNNETVQNAA